MSQQFKNAIQACNLNFLLGSGLSRPFLPTLGNIERLLTDLAKCEDISADTTALVRASIYKKYFDVVMRPNLLILSDDVGCHEVRDCYRSFLKSVNAVMLKRKLTLLGKEANLFTTNVDIFLDKTLEDLNLEYNDGFNGRFRPVFSLSNFKKSHFKRSLHFDNTAEIPVFNLLKLHGSLSWLVDGDDVTFSTKLGPLSEIDAIDLTASAILELDDETTVADLIAAAADKKPDQPIADFMKAYESLLVIVNPTKEKFRNTLTNETYYEMLRLFSNELEKENTVLFVMGFSFADEHIRDITLRAANANPTLLVYVFAHSEGAKAEIDGAFGSNRIKNDNIIVLAPDNQADPDVRYDFKTITQTLFSSIIDFPMAEEVGNATDEAPSSAVEQPAPKE